MKIIELIKKQQLRLDGSKADSLTRAARNRSFYNRLRRTTIGTDTGGSGSGDHWPRGRPVESIPADPSRNRVTRGIFRNRAAARKHLNSAKPSALQFSLFLLSFFLFLLFYFLPSHFLCSS